MSLFSLSVVAGELTSLLYPTLSEWLPAVQNAASTAYVEMRCSFLHVSNMGHSLKCSRSVPFSCHNPRGIELRTYSSKTMIGCHVRRFGSCFGRCSDDQLHVAPRWLGVGVRGCVYIHVCLWKNGNVARLCCGMELKRWAVSLECEFKSFCCHFLHPILFALGRCCR